MRERRTQRRDRNVAHDLPSLDERRECHLFFSESGGGLVVDLKSRAAEDDALTPGDRSDTAELDTIESRHVVADVTRRVADRERCRLELVRDAAIDFARVVE